MSIPVVDVVVVERIIIASRCTCWPEPNVRFFQSRLQPRKIRGNEQLRAVWPASWRHAGSKGITSHHVAIRRIIERWHWRKNAAVLSEHPQSVSFPKRIFLFFDTISNIRILFAHFFVLRLMLRHCAYAGVILFCFQVQVGSSGTVVSAILEFWTSAPLTHLLHFERQQLRHVLSMAGVGVVSPHPSCFLNGSTVHAGMSVGNSLEQVVE